MDVSAPTPHAIGAAYERVVLARILQEPTTAAAHLWSHCPARVLRAAGLYVDYSTWRQRRQESSDDNGECAASDEVASAIPDTGIDIVVARTDGSYEAVQCKAYADNNTVCQAHLAGLYRLLHNMRDHSPTACARVVYSGRLSHVLRTDAAISKTIKYEYVPCQSHDTKVEEDGGDGGDGEARQELYPAQQRALEAVQAWWRDEDEPRGYICLPCGCGKTLIAGRFLAGCAFDDLRAAVFAIPLREHAAQVHARCKAMLPTWRVLLVDSDGCRDVARINERLVEAVAARRQVLVVCTYKSADVVKLLSWRDVAPAGQWALIVDEFHNLTAADLQLPPPDETQDGDTTQPSDLGTLIDAAPKTLGMSATPRIYALEGSEEDRTTHMGPAVFTLSWPDAIAQGLVADYRVWLPAVSEGSNQEHIDAHVPDALLPLQARCNFLLRGMLEQGCRRCVLFLPQALQGSTASTTAQQYSDVLCKVAAWYGVDTACASVLCDDSAAVRRQRIRAFCKDPIITADGRPLIRLLLSVRILDEAVDLPECDSTFFATPTNCKLRAVQRAARAMRVDYPGKTAHVFLWCERFQGEQRTLLSALKEHDPVFSGKVRPLAPPNHEGDAEECKDAVDAEAMVDDVEVYHARDNGDNGRLPMYCRRCGWTTDRISNYMTHINKQKRCPARLEDIVPTMENVVRGVRALDKPNADTTSGRAPLCCPRCGFTTDRLSNYKAHISKKKRCPARIADVVPTLDNVLRGVRGKEMLRDATRAHDM